MPRPTLRHRARRALFVVALCAASAACAAPPKPAAPLPQAQRSDPDNDGIFSPHDACPNAPEDKDGFEDEDGCPDPDNDHDGVPDTRDACPNQASPPNISTRNGCPARDDDHDGIPNARDLCTDAPEDKDGFEDEDGCPDPDNDNDGILDAQDRCPNRAAPAHRNERGCPIGRRWPRPVARPILERIYFKRHTSSLSPKSLPLLDEVAARIRLMVNADVVEAVVIHGHTSTLHAPKRAQHLSLRRAEAVRAALIQRGLPARHLKTTGHGNTNPIAHKDPQYGHAASERAEFEVIPKADPHDTP